MWRRRHCLACGATFTTEEAARYGSAWQVRHGGGHLEPFSDLKLFMSLCKSCEHRKTALSDAQGLTETVVRRLHLVLRNGVVSSQDIAHVAQVALNRFDKAAATSYQAFHSQK